MSSPLAQAQYSHTITSTPQIQLQADEQLAQELKEGLIQDAMTEDPDQNKETQDEHEQEDKNGEGEENKDKRDTDYYYNNIAGPFNAGDNYLMLIKARQRTALTRRQNEKAYNTRYKVVPLETYYFGYIVRLKLYNKKRVLQSAPSSVFARIVPKRQEERLIYPLNRPRGDLTVVPLSRSVTGPLRER